MSKAKQEREPRLTAELRRIADDIEAFVRAKDLPARGDYNDWIKDLRGLAEDSKPLAPNPGNEAEKAEAQTANAIAGLATGEQETGVALELDPGHKYLLRELDGGMGSVLTFVKREGAGYPGNVGHYPGTTMQEVLRACIRRAIHVNGQIHHEKTMRGIELMRGAILAFEERAAERHQRVLRSVSEDIENEPVCQKCGHIQCAGTCHAPSPHPPSPGAGFVSDVQMPSCHVCGTIMLPVCQNLECGADTKP